MDRNDMLLLAEASSMSDAQTGVLIDMIVGTVLMRLDESLHSKHGLAIDFSPADINRFWQQYDIERSIAPNDEGRTEFRVRERATPAAPLGVDNYEDTRNAKAQAAPQKHDRPIWAVRSGGTLQRARDQKGASEIARQHHDREIVATVENRFCLHLGCPSSHCNEAEATSG